MKKIPLLIVMIIACCSFALAQQAVRGKVTDANGTPLAGVSVSVTGGKRGTTTGPDRTYRISAPSCPVLVVTHMAYTDKEVSVANGTGHIIVNQAARSWQEV